MSEKVCTKCGETKSLEEFSRHSRSADGRKPHCKACVRVHYNENRDDRVQYQRDWRRNNPTYHAERYAANREEMLDANRVWREANPEKLAEYRHRRGAREAGAPADVHTPGQLKEHLELFAPECFWCGAEYTANTVQTVDHVMPLSKGGAHSLRNLVPACYSCNSAKRDRAPEEWAAYRIATRGRDAVPAGV